MDRKMKKFNSRNLTFLIIILLHGIPPSDRKMGDNFIEPWRTSHSPLPLLGSWEPNGGKVGGGGVIILHTSFWGGQQGFLYWVDEGSPSLTGQKLIYPSSIRKSPPNRFIQKVLFPPPKVHPPPLNNNFYVITQYKFEF